MADHKTWFKIDRAAVGRVLKSKKMLDLTQKKASARYPDAKQKVYVGADRAKTRVAAKKGS